MTRRVGAAAAAVVVLVVVAGLALGGVGRSSGGDDRSDQPATTRPATTQPTTTSSTPGAASPVVADVEAFVARTRGLAFKHEVPVQLLDGDAFQARLLKDAEEDRADTAVDGRVLHALGLVDDDVDLFAVLQRFVGDAVVGFYDTESHELVVRAGTLTPYARATLAHELTHALDDQWFSLDRPELDERGHDEEALAFAALTEGDAVRVGDAYRAAMTRAERAQAAAEEAKLAGGVDLRGVPPVVPELISFPYVSGPPFVQALLRAGGERRVDSAFKVPPTTTEDILDPAGWFAGHEAVEVPAPKAEGPELDHGVYGQSTLELTLRPVVGATTARRAAEGWGGDRYVAWDAGGGRTCVRATFAMDSPRDLAQLESALRRWAAEEGASVVAAPSTVAFTACR